jgi:hypothetical protein
LVLLATALILMGSNGYAQAHEAKEHGAEEHTHSHHLGLFVGATSKIEEGGTDFTLGLEYGHLHLNLPAGRDISIRSCVYHAIS